MKRLTDIMATVTDARCDANFLKSLRRAGMDSVRINSAHVDGEGLRRIIRAVRRHVPGVGILMDTKGPEIRTTALDGALESVTFAEGDKVMIAAGAPTSSGIIGIAVEGVCGALRKGDRVVLDDGAMELSVSRADGDRVEAVVTLGGELGSRKTVNLPDTDLPPLPAVSERDRRAIEVAVEEGIDMIAHSFVRSAADVDAVRALTAGTPIRVYAKIECRDALKNFNGILEAADGILVARGDLGTQIDVATIPAVQHKACSLAHDAGKPVIVSTQILTSMVDHPYPTRAEMTHVAFAVRDGVETLLLPGETAQGHFPEECVDAMRRCIEASQTYFGAL